MTSLAELGEVSKAYDEKHKHKSGREAALAGAGLIGGGALLMTSGGRALARQARANGGYIDLGENVGQGLRSTKGLKRSLGGGTLAATGVGGIGTGAALGTVNAGRNKWEKHSNKRAAQKRLNASTRRSATPQYAAMKDRQFRAERAR